MPCDPSRQCKWHPVLLAGHICHCSILGHAEPQLQRDCGGEKDVAIFAQMSLVCQGTWLFALCLQVFLLTNDNELALLENYV